MHKTSCVVYRGAIGSSVSYAFLHRPSRVAGTRSRRALRRVRSSLFSWVSENGVGKVSRGSSEHGCRRIGRERDRGLLGEPAGDVDARRVGTRDGGRRPLPEPRKQRDPERRDCRPATKARHRRQRGLDHGPRQVRQQCHDCWGARTHHQLRRENGIGAREDSVHSGPGFASSAQSLHSQWHFGPAADGATVQCGGQTAHACVKDEWGAGPQWYRDSAHERYVDSAPSQ